MDISALRRNPALKLGGFGPLDTQAGKNSQRYRPDRWRPGEQRVGPIVLEFFAPVEVMNEAMHNGCEYQCGSHDENQARIDCVDARE